MIGQKTDENVVSYPPHEEAALLANARESHFLRPGELSRYGVDLTPDELRAVALG